MKRGAIAILLLSSIAGFQTSPVRATPYSFATIDDPSAAVGGNTTATGINNTGVVMGFYIDAGGITHGFVDVGGSFTTIDVPPALALGGEVIGGTSAYRLNDAGVVVGFYTANGGTISHGFVDVGGSFTRIDEPLAPAGGTTEVLGINNSGAIAGQYVASSGATHGFVKVGGVFTQIDAPLASPGSGTGVFSINNSGALIGLYFDNSSVGHAFLDVGGVFTDIVDPAAPAGGTLVEGLNNSGDVTGEYFDNSNVSHGFVDIGGAFTPIDDPLGTKGTLVIGINDADAVVGYYADSTGLHGFIATPQSVAVPEPAAIVLFGTALLCFGAVRRRGRAMKRGVLAVILLSSIIGFAPLAARANPYGFATIDEPLAFPGFTEAFGINDAGEIVGTFIDTSIVQHGFLLSGGSFTTIDAPFGQTAAFGINAASEIVGFSGAHGFLKTGASFSPVDFPGGTSTSASAINDAGDIVGQYQDAASHIHGFLKSGASFATIDDPNAIAADGGSFATGINAAGAIVGSYFDATGHHGFLKIGASFITIDDPNVSPGQTTAGGINNLGEIVGTYFDGTADHIFIDDGGIFTTIDDPGGVVVGTINAAGINDAGQIVGSYADETAGDHGFLATPVSVPEPATSILLVSGLLGLAASRCRPRLGRGDGLR